jgi:hypothetical protein
MWGCGRNSISFLVESDKRQQAGCFMLDSCVIYSLTLKMEAMCSSGTSADFHRIALRYNPEDCTLHSCRCESLKSSLEMGPWGNRIIKCENVYCHSVRELLSPPDAEDQNIVKKSPPLWNLKNPFSCSEAHATWPYPEPDEFNSPPHAP